MLTGFIQGWIGKLNGVFFHKDEIVSDRDQMTYWKNNIFSVISFLIMVIGFPVLIYGAILFYISGQVVLAVSEFMIYLLICLIVTRKSLPVSFRKFSIIVVFYVLSLLLLIFTGNMGAGMICVLFTLILAGTLLEERQAYVFLVINVAIFIVVTILLKSNVFRGLEIERYRPYWLINAGTAQVCGVVLIVIINAIYQGLQKQNSRLIESKTAILRSDMLHKAMIANISDVIMIIDSEGRIIYGSPNMEQTCGWSVTDFGEHAFWETLCPFAERRVAEEINLINAQQRAVRIFEARCATKSGTVKNFEFTAVNMFGDGNIDGILINFHDVTARRAREDEIICLNERDHLTNLYNRQYLDKAIPILDIEENMPLSLIYGDVNGLKIINDAFGHNTGDRLLESIADILRRSCRDNDLLFRAGGDEFLIILPKTDSLKAKEMSDTIGFHCDAFNKAVSDGQLYLSISLGIYTKEHAEITFGDAFKKAEDSMYMKKILVEKSIHNSILLSMQQVLFEKSQETEEHAERMTLVSAKMGLAMGLSNHQLDELALLAKLHDIGKISIDKKILEKPSKLTEDEWVEMKKHSEIGYRIAKASASIASIADYIHAHHERWDGNGYPQRLKGEGIPLLSRIISVVDSYDAMTENRIYRKGISKEAAIEEIKRNSGTQFDPAVVDVFLNVVNDK